MHDYVSHKILHLKSNKSTNGNSRGDIDLKGWPQQDRSYAIKCLKYKIRYSTKILLRQLKKIQAWFKCKQIWSISVEHGLYIDKHL